MLLHFLQFGRSFSPGRVHPLSAGPAASPAARAVCGSRARGQGRPLPAGPQRVGLNWVRLSWVRLGWAGGAAPAPVAPAPLRSRAGPATYWPRAAAEGPAR